MNQQEQNKASQRRFIEEFQTGGKSEVAYELIADDFVDNNSMPGFPTGKQGLVELFKYLRSAFADFRAEIHDMVAEGDLVSTRKSFHGIHNGEFSGIPPTGKPVTINLIDIVRYKNGQIAEHWTVIDQIGLMHQLGVIPPPSA
jgi:steroid delta-isomerase-like uncharacterized protein